MVIHADDLGINLGKDTPQSLYRWLVASMLFGRPVQQSVGADAYRALISHGLTSPQKYAEWGREELRAVLDEAGYARIDYIMTDELHEVMARIVDEYGTVSKLVHTSGSREELSKRLQEMKGIGPKTVEIYLRDIPKHVIA
ncbi:hypothetical protein M4I32_14815 [Microbacterium sp. LRZ72]|uniref:hypothetical protein n=1 Tax=Microbacterium sp. LRZ72 TaxID=2942481 RepID=UPI0029A8F093|nr:hypothetical protein [Microbacterium sp. LRZ72]MDX2378062.1 hypothetical protein [Microbacterium sp. LRZ72]